jgi:hypothetical protein
LGEFFQLKKQTKNTPPTPLPIEITQTKYKPCQNAITWHLPLTTNLMPKNEFLKLHTTQEGTFGDLK